MDFEEVKYVVNQISKTGPTTNSIEQSNLSRLLFPSHSLFHLYQIYSLPCILSSSRFHDISNKKNSQNKTVPYVIDLVRSPLKFNNSLLSTSN